MIRNNNTQVEDFRVNETRGNNLVLSYWHGIGRRQLLQTVWIQMHALQYWDSATESPASSEHEHDCGSRDILPS